MKSMIVAFALVLTAGPAMAKDTFASFINDDYAIDYLSWCAGDKVMAQNEEGKPYVRANCAEAGQVCKTYDAYSMSRVIYSAACAAKDKN